MKCILILFAINLAICSARVPPRNHEIEESAIDNKSKETIPNPSESIERSPIDTSISNNDERQTNPDLNKPAINSKKPVLILFRQHLPFSLLANRSPDPFSPFFNHHHHSGKNDFHDNLSLRLLSLFNPRRFDFQPDLLNTETEAVNSSVDSAESTELDNKRDVNPFEALFPNIFTIPKFPLDDEAENDSEASTTNENKTEVNIENKEKKVITVGGRKFVKTTQTKKVKNNFGHFHSVVSSYEPFNEKIHDENGNEKIKPSEETDEKNTLDKKDVETSTSASNVPSSTASSSIEKEEITPGSKLIESNKPEEKRPAENLSKETDASKNEIILEKSPDHKVDQMN